MSRSAELARHITVAHREPGYLRLSLPLELCPAPLAHVLEQGVGCMAGVESAHFDTTARQLAIRHDRALSAGLIARQLYGLLDKLPEAVPPGQAGAEGAVHEGADSQNHGGAAGVFRPASGVGLQPLLDRVKAMLPPPGSAPEGSLQARFEPLIASALTEKAVINFLNDLTAFYLVKVHWDLITKRWLKEPLVHGNAWLTTFYLLFLLIRYRKSP